MRGPTIRDVARQRRRERRHGLARAQRQPAGGRADARARAGRRRRARLPAQRDGAQPLDRAGDGDRRRGPVPHHPVGDRAAARRGRAARARRAARVRPAAVRRRGARAARGRDARPRAPRPRRGAAGHLAARSPTPRSTRSSATRCRSCSSTSPIRGSPRVVIDNVHGGELAAEHLLATRPSPHRVRRRSSHQRVRLHVQRGSPATDFAVRSNARAWRSSRAGALRRPRPRRGRGAGAWQLLGLPDPPSAIFAASDLQAIGVLKAAERLGLRVPEDVAVIGFDDVDLAEIVGLTTIRQPLREGGALAADLLLRGDRARRPSTRCEDAPGADGRRAPHDVIDGCSRPRAGRTRRRRRSSRATPGASTPSFGRDSLITALQLLPERPDDRPRDAGRAGGAPGRARRSADARGAGQDRARVPRRAAAVVRGRGLAGGRPVSLLRHGRRDVRGSSCWSRRRRRGLRARRVTPPRAGSRTRWTPAAGSSATRRARGGRAGAAGLARHDRRRRRRRRRRLRARGRDATRRRRWPTSTRRPSRTPPRARWRPTPGWARRAEALRARLSALGPEVDGDRGRRRRRCPGAGSQLGWLLWADALEPEAAPRGRGAPVRAGHPHALRPAHARGDRPELRASTATTAARVWPFDSWLGWGGLRARGRARRGRAGAGRRARRARRARARAGALRASSRVAPIAALATASRRGRSARAGHSSTGWDGRAVGSGPHELLSAGRAERDGIRQSGGPTAPEPLRCAPCTSGVGYADEPLPMSGDHAPGRAPRDARRRAGASTRCDAMVDATECVFYADGERDEVLEYLDARRGRRAATSPGSRTRAPGPARSRRAARAVAARRRMLDARYGTAGYGIGGHDEFGLRWIGEDGGPRVVRGALHARQRGTVDDRRAARRTSARRCPTARASAA